ncbi:MAG: bifunctional DedA family/phosphatase PAP2 family protein [Actinomycetota bacterium]|nr:bifunctional DedA family/phosphatase PAP2 family protein [Actinomycetota bacterium]
MAGDARPGDKGRFAGYDWAIVSNLADRILHLHGWLALLVIFAGPALESSTFVGFVFPGEVAVLLGGVLAFQHRVSLPAAVVAAVAGAIIGDSVGYEVGRHFGRRILEGTIGRVVKHHHLDRAEQYLATKGGRAVFIGRFTAALRVLIPGLAGMSGMRYRTFAAYNVAGGALWASGFVLLGYAGGSSYRHVEAVAKRASLLLLVVVVVIAVIVGFGRRMAKNPERVRAFADRQANRPWVSALRSRYRRQLDFLVRRFQPGTTLGLSVTASLAVIVLAGWAFGVLLQDVASQQSLNSVDLPVLHFFVRHREPWLTSATKIVTALGSSAVLGPVIAVVGLVWLARRRTPRSLVLLGVAYLGAEGLFQLIKFLVGRPRPPAGLAVGHFSGLAFPSGHATLSVAVWGMLAALVASSTSRWTAKVVAWALAIGLSALVGLTRLYLGAHWLTDVAGGWALGALWLFALLTAVRTVAGLRATVGAEVSDRTETAEPRAEVEG